MSLVHNGSSAIWRFECGDAIEIHGRIVFARSLHRIARVTLWSQHVWIPTNDTALVYLWEYLQLCLVSSMHCGESSVWMSTIPAMDYLAERLCKHIVFQMCSYGWWITKV